MAYAVVAIFIVGLIIMACGIVFASTADTTQKPGAKQMFRAFSRLCAAATAICFAAALILPIGLPQYKVWQQSKEGEAELAKAEQNRQIAGQEAKAKEESAMSLANAEVIRAQGVAQANKIIGDSLQNNDAYIHYLRIEALRESDSDVIYVPTEAGIPITESARFLKRRESE